MKLFFPVVFSAKMSQSYTHGRLSILVHLYPKLQIAFVVVFPVSFVCIITIYFHHETKSSFVLFFSHRPDKLIRRNNI